MKTQTLRCLCAAFLALISALPLHAQYAQLPVPSLINYQGRLTDAQGNPVTGNRTMAVRIYDAPSGGNMTYEENIGTVAVTNGTYSFQFGDEGDGILGVLNGVSSYLALSVNGTEESTRTRLLAVPYALKAMESEDAQILAINYEKLIQSLVTLGIIPFFEPNFTVSTLAGSEKATYADGQGSSASFSSPDGISFDAIGNVYVADRNNNRIRKISPSGSVTTLAGSGVQGYADGNGTAASFDSPAGVLSTREGMCTWRTLEIIGFGKSRRAEL